MNKTVMETPASTFYNPNWQMLDPNSFCMPKYKPDVINEGAIKKRQVNVS